MLNGGIYYENGYTVVQDQEEVLKLFKQSKEEVLKLFKQRKIHY